MIADFWRFNLSFHGSISFSCNTSAAACRWRTSQPVPMRMFPMQEQSADSVGKTIHPRTSTTTAMAATKNSGSPKLIPPILRSITLFCSRFCSRRNLVQIN